MNTFERDHRDILKKSIERDNDDYVRQKEKMKANMREFDKHQSPKIKKRLTQISKDQSQKVPDKLERLRDENLNLKMHKTGLESDVKIIQTQLQRQIKQLQSDKIITGKAAVFEKQLDELIEEQVKLKETEHGLMKKVKTAQKKSEMSGLENIKRTQPVVSSGSLAKTRAGSAKGKTSTDNMMGSSGLTLA